MVKVPEYEQNVNLRPIFRQGVDVQATPQAFGSNVGAGMENLAKGVMGLEQTLAHVQAIEDEAVVRRERNNYLREKDTLQYDPENGYLQKQGKNAIDAFPQYIGDLDKLRKNSSSNLTPAQQRIFEQAVAPLDIDAQRAGLVHKGNALKKFVVEESQNGAESFKNQALLSYRDSALWQKYTAAGLLEVNELGNKLGWPTEKLKQEQQNYLSDAVKQTTLRIAQSDPLAADKYMKDRADQLTAADKYSLEKGLTVPLKEAQSQRAASEFVSQQTQSGANGSAADMIRRFEGFKSGTYWDVNHDRVGYGSDTITRADGTVETVQKGMTVTAADAERDLQRRIFITQSKISNTVGDDKWNNLSAPAKAAVTSVAYNYGTLPESVTDAIRNGGAAEVAAAIRGLAGHNNGVNAKRRNQEADAVVGADMSASGQRAESYFTNLETYLSTIKDPEVQDLTRKRINAMLETQHKASTERERVAKASLWQYIDKGATPDQIPMDIRQAAGMTAVSSAWSYLDTVRKGRDIQSDDEMLYGLRRSAAQDPEFFSKIDLNDYRHKLSKSDIKELTGLQTSALTDQRKAQQDGLNLTAAYSQATQQLEAVGITATGKKGAQLEAANKRIAQFNNSLTMQMEEFKRENNNRAPTQADVQSMINRLLLPVVIKTPGMLWDSRENSRMFETSKRADGTTVDVAVQYTDIPIDLRRTIAADLQRELGRLPGDWEVVHRYKDFILDRGRTPIQLPDHGAVDQFVRKASSGVTDAVIGAPTRGIANAIDWFKRQGDQESTR